MEGELKPELKEKVSNIFQDFLTRITKLEELAGIGSRLLNGYQQALAKSLLNELEHLLEDLSGEIKTANLCLPPLKNEDCGDQLYQQITTDQSSFELGELEMTNYAVLMGIIYSMVKQDYVMQERIVNSLNLKSLSGELESYCVMWSLRPFIMDEVMHHAWRLIP
ncbi:hypothetical protein NC651_037054 [Populus alba x Populus x berolinensis]|nr:hypothetical protein NC651_037054 [Populus alba x Populus x berolinensis]